MAFFSLFLYKVPMSEILNFRLSFDDDIEQFLHKQRPGYVDYRIYSRALDARGANRGKKPVYNYKVEIIMPGQKFSAFKESYKDLGPLDKKPIIIGAGPAGLFCALRLAEYGVASTIIERGSPAHERMKKIARHWRYGEFDTENNVCFGEGGAGLFSDGKLITRIKSPYVSYVMNRFVDFGAPKETAYESNPHLGSNKIRSLISKMTDYLKSKGCEIHYNTRVEELIIEDGIVKGVKTNDSKSLYSDHIVLAIGHSSKEIYKHLKSENIAMKHKDFAIGVRVEHPRKLIDKIQHGDYCESGLGAARYKLTYHNKSNERGTYSFCMCPGGYVLSSGTDEDGIVVNGMSNFARNSPWSNSALVVSIKAGVDFDKEDILSGHYYQKEVERRAYQLSIEHASGKEVPAQNLVDFLDGKVSKSLNKTSCPSGIFSYDLNTVLPQAVSNGLREGLTSFNKNLEGFISNDALLLAPETRTSAPVTITRDKFSYESSSHIGLYPCGEGAGYAGGITSAAVDGVKVAMSILKTAKNFE